MRETMIAAIATDFIAAIGNLKALTAEQDADEIALSLELIGNEIRSQMWANKNRGSLMFAKIVLDHANTTKMRG